LERGAEDEPAIQPKGPGLEIFNIGFHAERDFLGRLSFPTISSDLSQTGDARLEKTTDVSSVVDGREPLVVGHEVRAGADDTHFSEQNVYELREFVYAQFSEPAACREHPGVIGSGKPVNFGVVYMEGPELENVKGTILETWALLLVDEWSRGLKHLGAPDDDSGNWEYEPDDKGRDPDIQAAFEEAVDGVLERLFAEAEEEHAFVFEHGDGVAEDFVEVGDDEEADAVGFAEPGVIAHGAVGPGELDHDEFYEAGGGDEFLNVLGFAQHGEGGRRAEG
jgi:hypothetical protein